MKHHSQCHVDSKQVFQLSSSSTVLLLLLSRPEDNIDIMLSVQSFLKAAYLYLKQHTPMLWCLTLCLFPRLFHSWMFCHSALWLESFPYWDLYFFFVSIKSADESFEWTAWVHYPAGGYRWFHSKQPRLSMKSKICVEWWLQHALCCGPMQSEFPFKPKAYGHLMTHKITFLTFQKQTGHTNRYIRTLCYFALL